MAVSRGERRAERRGRVVAIFGEDQAEVALDLLELTELAWHDCYNEITPSEDIIDDLLLCSRGDLDGLVRASRLAVTDWRDLKVWAESERSNSDR
jgi:hypothetical protein